MKCPKCGFENVDHATYCINCGSRLDGKIRCPKCGEFIEPDSTSCPHCGFGVPHNSSSNGFNSKREKIKVVFTKVFGIISIVLFALAILECFGFYLHFTSSETVGLWDGSAVYYLVLKWIDVFKVIGELNTSQMVSTFFAMGFQALAILINIIVVVTASIFGLVRSINGLKNKNYSAHRFLAIVLLSNLICLTIVQMFETSYAFEGTFLNFSISESKNTLLSLITISLFIMLISEPFYEFDKNKKSLLVNRILFSLIFVFGVLLMMSIRDSFITIHFSTDVTYTYGIGDILSDYIFRIAEGGIADNIAMLLLSSFQLVLFLAIITLVAVSIIFMIQHYFHNTFRRHSCYIPLYAIAISILVIAILSLIVQITINVMLFRLYNTNIEMNYSMYVLTVLVVGFPFATMHLTRKIKQNEKLAMQTTVLERKESERDQANSN